MDTREQLTSAVLRAARQLRNVTRNLIREDPEAVEAWERLDGALNARDDFAVEGLDKESAR